MVKKEIAKGEIKEDFYLVKVEERGGIMSTTFYPLGYTLFPRPGLGG